MDTEDKDLIEIDNIVDEVERLPQEKRQVVLERLEIYQGDLPHPDILKGYQNLDPNAAQKIIDNGIAESQHRREMENKYLLGNIASHKLGQLFGFIIALVVIIGGIYLISTGKQIAGSVLTGTTALGLIGLFTGNNQNKNKA